MGRRQRRRRRSALAGEGLRGGYEDTSGEGRGKPERAMCDAAADPLTQPSIAFFREAELRRKVRERCRNRKRTAGDESIRWGIAGCVPRLRPLSEQRRVPERRGLDKRTLGKPVQDRLPRLGGPAIRLQHDVKLQVGRGRGGERRNAAGPSRVGRRGSRMSREAAKKEARGRAR